MVNFSLSKEALNAGYKIEQFAEIASTNIRAYESARLENDKVWFVAKHQTGGKGRHGRKWQFFEGNLACSLLVQLDLPAKECANLGFVAGLSLFYALKSFDENLPLTLKWPNDILLNGDKLAGILLEMKNLGLNKQAIIIGFGVNIANKPVQNMPYKAICLKDYSLNISASQLFERLSKVWLEIFEQFNKGEISHILQIWQQNAKGLGEKIIIENYGKRLSGIFKKIDENGCIILEKNNGEIARISAGDIYFSN